MNDDSDTRFETNVLRLSEQESKPIRLARHCRVTHFKFQRIFLAAFHIGVVNKDETTVLHFLDNQHRVHTTTILTIVRLHVTTRVINDAVETTGFQRIEG